MPEIPAPRRWEQEVLEFKASLVIWTLFPSKGKKTERVGRMKEEGEKGREAVGEKEGRKERKKRKREKRKDSDEHAG